MLPIESLHWLGESRVNVIVRNSHNKRPGWRFRRSDDSYMRGESPTLKGKVSPKTLPRFRVSVL